MIYHCHSNKWKQNCYSTEYQSYEGSHYLTVVSELYILGINEDLEDYFDVHFYEGSQRCIKEETANYFFPKLYLPAHFMENVRAWKNNHKHYYPDSKFLTITHDKIRRNAIFKEFTLQ